MQYRFAVNFGTLSMSKDVFNKSMEMSLFGRLRSLLRVLSNFHGTLTLQNGQDFLDITVFHMDNSSVLSYTYSTVSCLFHFYGVGHGTYIHIVPRTRFLGYTVNTYAVCNGQPNIHSMVTNSTL